MARPRPLTPASTTLLASVVVVPFAGLYAAPLAILGAVVVLIALVVAGVDANACK